MFKLFFIHLHIYFIPGNGCIDAVEANCFFSEEKKKKKILSTSSVVLILPFLYLFFSLLFVYELLRGVIKWYFIHVGLYESR